MEMGVRALFRLDDTSSNALVDLQSRVDQLGGRVTDRWHAKCSLHNLENGEQPRSLHQLSDSDATFRKLYVVSLPGDGDRMHLSIDGTIMRSTGDTEAATFTTN
eukprot:TRINITY_DN1200_c0_g1_i4.p1 TRINITY_DN1200_c0_g1~~TRINITY_DN1200_c0_g1_i4.p1  ORF type:complete len:104 (+),score=6.24 TRINITY_DN1200_c0_g1_i4:61-372(+)